MICDAEGNVGGQHAWSIESVFNENISGRCLRCGAEFAGKITDVEA